MPDEIPEGAAGDAAALAADLADILTHEELKAFHDILQGLRDDGHEVMIGRDVFAALLFAVYAVSGEARRAEIQERLGIQGEGLGEG